MFFSSRSAGVWKGIPCTKIFPPFTAAERRSPESSISAVMFGSHDPPIPCFGYASEQKGERGETYSLRKICATLSLNKGWRLTLRNSPAAEEIFQLLIVLVKKSLPARTATGIEPGKRRCVTPARQWISPD